MKKVESEIAFLRLEGLVILGVALWLYNDIGYSWWWFALGLLIPDVSMAGYAVNNRVGAFVYNLGHSLAFPLLVAFLGYTQESNVVLAIGLIWLAHVGMDRAFGFGLKKKSGFKYTHLGDIGQEYN